ncbi:Hint domain-containing protein, partial [Acidisphaera rubrifaciens]|uniref:Hint domain-containing protein n=1 Tax=Acidisphaera rubrifaciens TaxID=50715 RepID=UPI000B189BA3
MSGTKVLFAGYDANFNQGLWISDGTAAGTQELIPAGSNGNLAPSSLVADQGIVLFSAMNKAGVYGLWTTDGTSAGTQELTVAGASTGGLLPSGLTYYDGKVYFQASDAANARGLWVSDGTSVGTKEITVNGAATFGVNPTDLTVVGTTSGSRLAFGGADANGNTGLWISDGTTGGTQEIYAGTASGGVAPQEITPLSTSEFLFAGFDAGGNAELFVSNGTAAGTKELTGIAGAATGSDFVAQGGNMVVIGGHAIFAAYDNTSSNAGLWTSDGTAAGTHEIAVSGASTDLGLTPGNFVQLGTLALFSGFDAADHDGLWVTDGTSAGTHELTGITGAAANFSPTGMTDAGGLVYFSALDAAGHQGLWVTNGTASGTHEIVPTSNADTSGLAPSGFAVLNLACFAAGTRLATPDGDIAVEAVTVGTVLRGADGAPMPAVWIGSRTVDCARHPAPASVWPVRIRAGAFAPGQPARDLYLSPDHAVFAEGVLIPVRHLVNGTTIAQVPRPSVTYYHVELARHGVLLADGLACESYLDTGQRASFAQGGAAIALHADFAVRAREAGACAPFAVAGTAVDRVR